MGRKAKPAAVKKLMGNPGRRPIKDVVLPDTGEVVKPDFLERRDRASALWEQYAPPLRLLGTLRAESAHLLATWCWLTSSFEEAPDDMTASKISQIRSLSSMLGMDPTMQAKLNPPVSDDGEGEGAGRFFGPQLAR